MVMKFTLFVPVALGAISLLNTNQACAKTEPLRARVDAGLKAGTERNILQTEAWIPIVQDLNRVLYTDIRLTGDDSDNREQNVGIGYRQAHGSYVYGAHTWIDRRHSEHGNTMYQSTVGIEALGSRFDGRLNFYIPLTGSKSYIARGTGRSSPYLAGTGLFVDTAATGIEEAQHGFDLELGVRVPVAPEAIDDMRVYGGFYAFRGDDTEGLTGWRARTSINVNSWLGLGARFQHDDVRGSQSFLEATLRLPGKRTFKEYGVQSRLDESPERDIDIVAGAQIVNDGLRTPVIGAQSGAQQRILHVDNTAAPGGDGSMERPFNTLAAAQAALQDYDVVYIHRGDGTTTGQNAGITIARRGVQLIGSGADFYYDTTRFSTVSGLGPSSTLIARATQAPSITNGAGDGVLVTARDVTVGGISVAGTTARGVLFFANGTDLGTASAHDVTATGNNGPGIRFHAINGGQFSSVSAWNNTSTNNLGAVGVGIEVKSENFGSHIGQIALQNNTFRQNAAQGSLVWVIGDGATMGDITLAGNSAISNTSEGLYIQAREGGLINSASLNQNHVESNQIGIMAFSTERGRINSVSARENTALSNNSNGIRIQAGVNNASIGTVTAANNTLTSNIGNGMQVIANSSGRIDSASVTGNTARFNTNYGITVDSNSISTLIKNISISDNIAENNNNVGYVLNTSVSGVIENASVLRNLSQANQNRGFYLIAQSGGNIQNLTVSGNSSLNNIGAAATGIDVTASAAGSRINNATIENNAASGNGFRGLFINAASGGIFDVVSGVNNDVHYNASHGVYITAANGSLIDQLTMRDLRASNNTGHGSWSVASANGRINSANFSNITTNSNGIVGLRFQSDSAGSLINNLTIRGAETNANSNVGTLVFTSNGGNINTLDASYITANNNVGEGFGLYTGNVAGGGGISSATLSHIIAKNNVDYGIELQAKNTGFGAISISNSTLTGNGSGGILVDDDSPASFIVDMGGGSLGSAGLNRLYGNSLRNIYVDVDAATLSAQNNWWGQTGGPVAGDVNLEGASLIDTTLPLSADPRPQE